MHRARAHVAIAGLALVLGPAVARADAQAEDSAAVARAAYASAITALRGGDTLAAKRFLERAANAWPTQEAYLYSLARVAARSGDSATALRALDRSASLGVGRDIARDPALAALAASPRFAGLVARHDRNRAPLVNSTVATRLTDDHLFLESLAYDATARRFLATDVRRGRVVVIDSLGATRTFAAIPPVAGSPLGIAIDERARAVWVGTGVPAFPAERDSAGSRDASLLELDLVSGAIVKAYRLGRVAGGHVLGDVACTRRGDVYATDSTQPVIYRVLAGTDSVAAWISSPLFHSLQGLAFSADERTLFVADYSHGLLRVDVATGAVARIADLPNSTTLGIDGLRLARGQLIAIQNGIPVPRVLRISLDADGRSVRALAVLDQNVAEADEPTNGALVGGNQFVYPSHVPWNEYDDAGAPRPGATLRAPALLRLSIPGTG